MMQWQRPAIAVCFALLLPFLISLPTTQSTQPLPHTKQAKQPRSTPVMTHKGFPFEMLHAHRRGHRQSQTFTEARHTHNGTVLFPGDVIQFRYQLLKPTHLMIVSLNEKGEVFPFVPLNQPNSILVAAGEGTLPKKLSLILDQYVGQERFFIIGGKRPFQLRDVKRTLLQKQGTQHTLKNWNNTPQKWLWFRTILIEKQPRSMSPFAVEK